MARIANRRRRRAFAPPWSSLALVMTLALVARGARAESQRLVVGTHDVALVSALSVAVSPRGMSVVELSEPLVGVADIVAARHEVWARDVAAVVWLCDDDAGVHALCFCDRDGRLTVRRVAMTAPLSPPDAAALALTVKVLLGRAPAASGSPPSAPPVPVAAARSRPVAGPAFVVELMTGARLQSPAEQHVALRLGLKGVFAPAAFGRRVGLGVGVAAGPSLATGGPRVNDVALQLFARGRRPVSTTWLEVDLGPSAHLLAPDKGDASVGERRVDLSLDALVGLTLPAGRYCVGVRAGGFLVLTSGGAAARVPPPVSLPRWNPEVMATAGIVFP